MKKILYLMAALAIFAVSCTKPEPVKPSLTLSTPADVTVPTDGGIQSVSFTSNVPWTASIDNSNWSVSPTSGEAGTATVKVTAPNNTSEDAIVVKVTLKAETASQVVTFTQLQKDAMVVDVTSYEAPAEGGKVSVKVKANVEVTATTDASWLKIATATKAAVEKTFDVEVSANEGEAREGTIILSGAGKKAEVTIKQAAFEPYFLVENLEVAEDGHYYDIIANEGGELTYNVKSNVEWSIKDYNDSSQPFLKAETTKEGNNAVVKVTIEGNGEYASRMPYVKFTIPAIQDPVFDDSGEPTGETTDHVVRIYFEQPGLLITSWTTTLPETVKSGAQLSIAKIAGMYMIYDGVAPMLLNPETGEISDPMMDTGEGIEIAEILNDDAGNFLAVTKTAYQNALDILVIPAGTPESAEVEPIVVVHSYMDYYGYCYGHVQAKGNVLENGVITALIGEKGSVQGLYWEIKDGKATTWAPYGESEEETCQPKYLPITVGEGKDIWVAGRVAFSPFGTSAADGFLYDGYDDLYNMQYILPDGTTNVLGTLGDWLNGVSSMVSGKWGTKSVVVANSMSWVPAWGESKIVVNDASTMETIVTIPFGSWIDAPYMAEPSSCLLLEEKGDALIIYSIDGSQGYAQKFVIPAK